MRIAIAAGVLKPISEESTGGTEMFTHILTEGLVEHGIDTTLFATSDTKTTAHLTSVCSSSQTGDHFEGTIEMRTLYEILQTSKIIQDSKNFDIIHNNYFQFFILTSFSHLMAPPIVTSMHNHFWQYPNLKSVLSQTQRKGKDMVVFASHAAQNLAEGLFDSQVIYHGINISPFTYSNTPDDYILWFSRMVPRKGIKDAIEAAEKGNFKLIAAGGQPTLPNDKSYIQNEILPHFNKTTILYAGVPSDEEKIKLYTKAKALLFSTHTEEQFGLVAAEAMACGTPVIAYNYGALSEVVEDGVTGFIIDPDDEQRPGKGSWIIKKQGVDGLIEAVQRISEIDRKKCRERVETHFTQDRMINEYIQLYKKMI